MKFWLLIFALSWLYTKSFSQFNYSDVLSRYFKANPYTQEFSSFFNELNKDTTIEDRLFQKRTQSEPFHFSGFYKNFNPFRFKASDVSITLSDIAIDYSTINDSVKLKDTILFYSISGIAGEGVSFKKTVEKELEAFHRRHGSFLGNATYRFSGTKDNITGESYSYFLAGSVVAPLVAAWNKEKDSEFYSFSVTLLMKVRQNVCGLPDPFD